MCCPRAPTAIARHWLAESVRMEVEEVRFKSTPSEDYLAISNLQRVLKRVVFILFFFNKEQKMYFMHVHFPSNLPKNSEKQTHSVHLGALSKKLSDLLIKIHWRSDVRTNHGGRNFYISCEGRFI